MVLPLSASNLEMMTYCGSFFASPVKGTRDHRLLRSESYTAEVLSRSVCFDESVTDSLR